MKRSVNFNGFKHRRITAKGFVDACRALGMSDEDIKQAILEMQDKALPVPLGEAEKKEQAAAIAAAKGENE